MLGLPFPIETTPQLVNNIMAFQEFLKLDYLLIFKSLHQLFYQFLPPLVACNYAAIRNSWKILHFQNPTNSFSHFHLLSSHQFPNVAAVLDIEYPIRVSAVSVLSSSPDVTRTYCSDGFATVQNSTPASTSYLRQNLSATTPNLTPKLCILNALLNLTPLLQTRNYCPSNTYHLQHLSGLQYKLTSRHVVWNHISVHASKRSCLIEEISLP